MDRVSLVIVACDPTFATDDTEQLSEDRGVTAEVASGSNREEGEPARTVEASASEVTGANAAELFDHSAW